LRQLLELHKKANVSGNVNDYFLGLIVHAYLIARRSLIENLTQGSKPDIESKIESLITSRGKDDQEFKVFESVQYEWSIEQLWSSIFYSLNEESEVDNVELLESKFYNLYLRPSKSYRQDLSTKNIKSLSLMPEIKVVNDIPLYRCPRYFNLYTDR